MSLMRGIAGRLAIFISLVALVATAAVGYMVYSGAEDSLIDAASDRVAHTAETVSVRLWATLGGIGDDIRFLAKTPPVRGIVRAKLKRGFDPMWSMHDDEWGEQLAEIFRSLLESRSSYLQLRFIGLANNGRELVRAERRNGHAVFAEPSNLSAHGEAPYVQVASQLPPGALYLSEVTDSEGEDGIPPGTPILHVATPIFSDAGEPFGVLVVTVEIRSMMAPLGPMIDPNQTLYVASSSGNLLSVAGRLANGDEEAINARWDRLRPALREVITGSPTEIRMLDARLGEETRGIAYFEEVALDPSHDSSTLLIGVTEPHDTILAGVRRVRNQSAIITLLLSLAALGAALGASGYLTKPLRQITRAVSNFGGDRQKVSLPVDRTDEIGLLARSFESMEQQIELQMSVLEDEERRQRTILETSAEGIIVVGADGRIEAFNPAAEEIFRTSSSDVMGESLEKLTPVTAVASLLDNPHQKGGTTELETVAIRADGEEIPISILWSEFEWRDERKLTVFVQDISERKEAERSQERLVRELETERERLRKLSETLEERVRDRTRDLELLNRELEVTNRELREIASVASHDLQEPLRKLRAFADLLGTEYHDVLDEGGRFYTQRIFGLSERMSNLINDLLAFSGVISTPAPYRNVDLSRVANDVVGGLQRSIRESGAVVDIGPLPEIEGDPAQLRELFEQLIENALVYRRPNVPPEIVIRGSIRNDGIRESDPTIGIIEVSDNGVGFDEKYAGRIFAPFEKLAGRSTEGTGMGLTICRRIVENHRGTIMAQSTPGEGSTFIVTLPVRQPTVLQSRIDVAIHAPVDDGEAQSAADSTMAP